MNIETIVNRLENARSYVNNPELLLSKSQTQELNDEVDRCVRYAKYGRYHVTALGVFSTGKSTLLNAMLEEKLLPSADLPVTAITTEIYYSDQTSFFIPFAGAVQAELVEDFKQGLSSFAGVEFTAELIRDGEKSHGLGGILATHDVATLYRIISELTSQGQRNQQPFLKLKTHLEKDHNLPLWLGLSVIPEWLKDIVLTDAPGTGSVDESHEIIINKVIPESQLVLFLIESTKVGSAIDKGFCSRISNTYHRKVFYILNKIDQQNPDEQADALDLAKRCVPEVAQGGEIPEFLSVAGLYAFMANEVAGGRCSMQDLAEHSKINLTRLLFSPEWSKADEKEKQRLLADFLLETSKFQALRNRIEEYLRNENKDLAIVQQAYTTIASLASIIRRNCDNAIRVLESDQSVESLRQQAEALHTKRLGYQRDAENIIQDCFNSALDSETGLEATIRGLLANVPMEIAEELNETLKNDDKYKELQKAEALQSWLTKKLSARTESVGKKLETELNKRYQSVLEQLTPILDRIERANLATLLDEFDTKNIHAPEIDNTNYVLGGAAGGALAGGGLAAGLAIAGIGTGTVVTGGAAGWLAAHGLTTLATWAATSGVSGTVATTTFWGLGLWGFAIPVVGVAAVAGAIAAFLFFGRKDRKIQEITSQTLNMLDKLVISGETVNDQKIDSVAENMFQKCKQALKSVAEELNNAIAQRLQQLDEEESILLEQAQQEQTVKNEKIDNLKTIDAQMVNLHNEAQDILKKA